MSIPDVGEKVITSTVQRPWVCRKYCLLDWKLPDNYFGLSLEMRCVECSSMNLWSELHDTDERVYVLLTLYLTFSAERGGTKRNNDLGV